MACGLPAIATPWSGPADFLSPWYSYTLRHSFRYFRAQSLAQCLVVIYLHKTRRLCEDVSS
jgi:hypothetical protein